MMLKVSALKDKRATLAQEIVGLERQLRHRKGRWCTWTPRSACWTLD